MAHFLGFFFLTRSLAIMSTVTLPISPLEETSAAGISWAGRCLGCLFTPDYLDMFMHTLSYTKYITAHIHDTRSNNQNVLDGLISFHSFQNVAATNAKIIDSLHTCATLSTAASPPQCVRNVHHLMSLTVFPRDYKSHAGET